jgi:zinc/manganese transport system ATP-binding protein
VTIRPSTAPRDLAIDLDRVTLSLGGRPILKEISLAIAAGEFIGVLGPNGAGKTTLMRALLGLVPATTGSIRVLGETATRGNPAIGYMPQFRSQAGQLNLRGWDFVAAACDGHLWGLPLPNRRRAEIVDQAIELVGAHALARRPLNTLSGGERQRLLLAQALLGEPQLLLLDEPLISLDPHHQRVVVDLVREVQQRLGIAVLFSAHELNPLLPAIDRVLYLGRGQAALGKVDEVITSAVLSRLYGAEIEVVRLKGRIFVMSGGLDLEQDAHQHDDGHVHDHQGHGHGGHDHDDNNQPTERAHQHAGL